MSLSLEKREKGPTSYDDSNGSRLDATRHFSLPIIFDRISLSTKMDVFFSPKRANKRSLSPLKVNERTVWNSVNLMPVSYQFNLNMWRFFSFFFFYFSKLWGLSSASLSWFPLESDLHSGFFFLFQTTVFPWKQHKVNTKSLLTFLIFH